MISRGLQLEAQLVAEKEDYDVEVGALQSRCPTLCLTSSQTQERVKNTLFQSQVPNIPSSCPHYPSSSQPDKNIMKCICICMQPMQYIAYIYLQIVLHYERIENYTEHGWQDVA